MADTKLTFATGRTITQASSAGTPTTHGIAIGGKASLPPGATYIVASADSTVGTLTVDSSSVLSLAEGYLVSQSDDANAGLSSASPSSKVVLTGGVGATGASLKGAGLVKAGGTTISGATGSWQAVVATGNVAITVDAITGTDAALVADANTGAITIGDNAAATTTLTVTSLSVNILAGGSIVIPFPVSGGNENVFKLANSGASLRGLNITGNGGPAISGITSATVVGVGTAGNPGSADAGNFISVADGNTAATITGSASTSDVTIDKTTAITAAAI